MPVIPVGPIMPTGGPVPRETARKLAKTTAMAGVAAVGLAGLDGSCWYDEATNQMVGDCGTGGSGGAGGGTSGGGGGGGSDWWQQILMGASKTYSQVLLNQNPAPVYRTVGPGGSTVVYQPTGQAIYGATGPGGTAAGQSPAYGLGLGSNTTMLLVAGLVVVAVVMSKR